MEISTSVLNVKEENAIETFYRIETAHTDYFHIDVMDGKFVKMENLEKMQEYSDNLKNITNIPLDVHLMAQDVKEQVDKFISCKPRVISFHIEAMKTKEETMKIINYIKENGCKVGIAISPETKVETLYEYLQFVHNILVMTVEPGKGGQKLIPETIKKIEELKRYIDENKLETEIEVDGGINLDNIKNVKKAGAEIAVVGTFLIDSKDYKYTMNKLKQA